MAEDADTKIAFKVTADGVKEASAGLDSVGDALDRQRQAVKAMDDAVAQSDFTARLTAYRTEADKLNATQSQTAVALAQVGTASAKASADIAAQTQTIKDSATKFTNFGGAVSSAFDGLAPGVKKFQDALDPALRSVDGLIAKEQQLSTLRPPSAIGAPTSQAASGGQFAELEAANTALAKAELDKRADDVAQSLASQIDDAKAKFEELESDKTDIVKSGLDNQQTEVERSIADEIDVIKKKFEGVNIGKMLGNSDAAVASVAALGNEIDQVSRKLTALKAMNDAAAQSGFLSRMAEYRTEAAALNAQQDQNSSAFQRTTRAINENEGAFELNTNELKHKGREGAEVIARLAEAFKESVPSISEYSGTIDIGIRSMSGFLGLLGGGPGIVLGGVVAAVGLLGAAMGSAKKEADELAKSTDKNSHSFAEYIEQIAKARDTHFSSAVAGDEKKRADALTAASSTGAAAPIQQYDDEISALNRKIADTSEEIERLETSTKGSWATIQNNANIVVPSLRLQNEAFKEQIDVLKEHKQAALEDFGLQQQAARSQKEFSDTLASYGAQGKIKETKVDFSEPEQATNKPRKDDASATQKRLDENLAAIQKLRTLQSDYQDKQVEEAKAADKRQVSDQID